MNNHQNRFNMKNLKCLLIVAAVAMALVGCRKPVEVSFGVASLEVEAQGGTVDVTLQSNGEWSIDAMPDWLTVSPTSGSGNATLSLTALPNNSSLGRTGEIKASTKDNTAVMTVSQGFVANYLTIAPALIECGSTGGEFNIEVMSNVDWAVSGMPSWMTCTPMGGSGNAVVTVNVIAISDDTQQSREADVVFGNEVLHQTLHVSQNVDYVSQFMITPENIAMACGGESKSVMLTSNESWTATPNAEWVTLDKTQGGGDAEVVVTVSENPEYEARRTTVLFTSSSGIQIALMVTQEASPDPHFLEVSPLSFNFGKEGGQQVLNIACDTEWKIGVESSWLSFSEIIGNGNATVTLTAMPNVISEPRTLTFEVVSGVLSQRVRVTQDAGDEPIWVNLSPDTLSAGYQGAINAILEVSSNTTWTLEASSWIMNLPIQQMQGDATLYFIIDMNSSAMPRYGFIRALHNGTVMAEIVVAQEGKPDLLETDITEVNMRPEGGEFIIHVTSNQGWQVLSDVEWISCSPTNGFGNGDITVTVQELLSTHSRTGHINLKAESGKLVVVTVTQQH